MSRAPAFLAEHALDYAERLNLVVAPLRQPVGLRGHQPLEQLGVRFLVHVDLHETTDSDELGFRPALAARDGEVFEPGHIPDGFYTVGDTENPQPEFQAAIIAGVERVTHIAEPDAKGEIIGSPVTQNEVYPDSPRATAEICNAAQVAAVRAALDHALAHA